MFKPQEYKSESINHLIAEFMGLSPVADKNGVIRNRKDLKIILNYTESMSLLIPVIKKVQVACKKNIEIYYNGSWHVSVSNDDKYLEIGEECSFMTAIVIYQIIKKW